MLTSSATSIEAGSPARGLKRYLIILLVICLGLGIASMFVVSFLPYDEGGHHDFFSQVPRDGDTNWYRDFGGRHIPQIQDQDVFYSGVGSSIAAVRKADIVFLGPSFVSYAVDRATLQAAPMLGRLNIYNMAFVGIRGGEFSRKVIERWNIRAPLWVINVDDQFVHFFSADLDLTIGPQKTPIAAVKRNWLNGHLAVIGRNLRWRVEDIINAYYGGHFPKLGLYRNISNGDMSLADNLGYVSDKNKQMPSARDQGCHTTPEVIEYARMFLKQVGGHVVFTLVPHSQSCLGQAQELAKALNVELIAPPFDGLTTVDGGGHLDKRGAEKFTSYLATELVKTEAFKQAIATRAQTN